MAEVGKPIVKINDNNTYFVGFVLSVFNDMAGNRMYFAQRPSDGMFFFGYDPIRTKELPPLASSKY